MRTTLRAAAAWAALLTAALWAQAPAPAREPILQYIAETWTTLTRTHKELARAAADPKFPEPSDGRWPVYVPASADAAAIAKGLAAEMAPENFAKIAIRRLAPGALAVKEQGLLYLPNPYVVPGGRFNEMYGWDSYFIVLGLLRDGRTALARDMVDNFLYEIANYGKILNANRTYYLTRSQPPFLTEMILAVYRATNDKAWLEQALPRILATHEFWTTAPHLTPETGLSRYYDLGEGPAPEVLSAEKDAQGRTHYDLVKQYFRDHTVTDYDVGEYYDRRRDMLTMLFYKGDRSMRESGFDPSDRFGKFNLDVIHYNPVCLNTLLEQMEQQTAEILRILGRANDAAVWDQRAAERATLINRLLWDQAKGLYFDFEFVHRRMRDYPFLTTFFPLWAGIASKEQAAAVARNLPLFERPGGLQTSTHVSGNQWDAPFAWAPLQKIAVEGLRRYGYTTEANRVAREFLSMVAEQYRQRGIIVEKYDAVVRSIDVSRGIQFGYSSNEAGFGWTNAVFTELLDQLPAEERRQVLSGK